MNVFMAMGGRGTRGLRRRDPRGCAGSDLRPREGVEVARDLALERAAQRAERQPEVRRDADDAGGGGDGAADARALYAEDVAVPRRANVEAAAEGAGDGLGVAVRPRAAEHVAPADLDVRHERGKGRGAPCTHGPDLRSSQLSPPPRGRRRCAHYDGGLSPRRAAVKNGWKPPQGQRPAAAAT